jgi:hypothetical protein
MSTSDGKEKKEDKKEDKDKFEHSQRAGQMTNRKKQKNKDAETIERTRGHFVFPNGAVYSINSTKFHHFCSFFLFIS